MLVDCGSVSREIGRFFIGAKIVRHFSNFLLKYFAVVRKITIFAIQY